MSMEIYLTNLGKYVEGCLVGQWVKLPIDEDKLNDILKRIGINEEYEEFFITDYESSFVGLRDILGEHENIEALNELAEMFDLNVTFCCSLFNKNLGCSFMEYCAKLKMEKAAEMIKDGEMDIYRIAEYLNYDYFYFNKLFKKHYGMTPRRYRSNNQ